jgi:hypothetical protein
MPKNNRLVALLPIFNMIINVEGEDEQQLEIKGKKSTERMTSSLLKQFLRKCLIVVFSQGSFKLFYRFKASSDPILPTRKNMRDCWTSYNYQHPKDPNKYF